MSRKWVHKYLQLLYLLDELMTLSLYNEPFHLLIICSLKPIIPDIKDTYSCFLSFTICLKYLLYLSSLSVYAYS